MLSRTLPYSLPLSPVMPRDLPSQVMDHDMLSRDDLIAKASLPIAFLYKELTTKVLTTARARHLT